MQSGHLNTFPILEFAAKHPLIPGGKNPGVRLYGKLCGELTKNIPQISGWYFWGCFNERSIWNFIYIGKAENTGHIASLRYRIADELKTERMCFWAEVVGDQKTFADQSSAFVGRFDQDAKRALRKKGSHFIIWVGDFSLPRKQIEPEEKILISRYGPPGNKMHKSIKKMERTSTTRKILKALEGEIAKILSFNSLSKDPPIT